MAYETLRYERDGHVVVLTYDRPEQRNAISRTMNAELHDAWQRFRDDDEAFVLVITGAGDAFCAGWDLADAAEWGRPDWDEFRAVLRGEGPCNRQRLEHRRRAHEEGAWVREAAAVHAEKKAVAGDSPVDHGHDGATRPCVVQVSP